MHKAMVKVFMLMASLVSGCATAQQVPRGEELLQPVASEEKCFVLKPLDRAPIVDRSAMCRALEDNLNEFCGGPSPMCGLRFSANHPEFQLPEWTPLDLPQNLPLLENMVRGRACARELRNRGGTGYEWSLLEPSVRDPNTRLMVGQVDIMNHGVQEPVYEFWPNACDASIGALSSAQILLGRHAQIITNPEWLAAAARGEMSFDGQFALAGVGNVFLFESRTFLFVWSGGNPHVEEISSAPGPEGTEYIGSRAVCAFDYRPSQTPR